MSPDFSRYEKALYCTTKTHRCLHAAHAYTGKINILQQGIATTNYMEIHFSGVPCAAYIPMMNHHTMPKVGFGNYRGGTVGTFYLPKILTSNQGCHNKVSLEFSHTNNKKYSTSVPLPSEKLDSNKRYLVTFTMNDKENELKDGSQLKAVENGDDDTEQSK